MNREWETEPDEVKFQYKGYNCEILRPTEMGHLCGYVDLPETSKFFGQGYDDIPVRVHGGLTYAGFNNGFWRIGFDCAHAGDLIPYLVERHPEFRTSLSESYKNIVFVQEGLYSLVDQIIDKEHIL